MGLLQKKDTNMNNWGSDNKKKLVLTLIFASVVILGFGGKMYTDYIVSKTKQEMKADEDEKERRKKDLLKYLAVEHTSDEIEQTLTEGFKYLSREDCTSVVDTYIYGTYNVAMNEVLDDDTTNIIFREVTGNTLNIDGITDNKIRKRIRELSDQHVVVRYVNGSLFYDVDYGYFVSAFGDYINPDYKDLLSFYEWEKSQDYCDETEQVLYPEVVEARLELLFSKIQEYADSDILPMYYTSYYFYKSVYLGAYSQSYIYDALKVRPEIVTVYEKYAINCSDNELADFLKEIVSDYREADLSKTVYISEKIKRFCGLDSNNGD